VSLLPGFLFGLLLAGGAGWFLLPHWQRKQAERQLQDRCRAARAIVLSYDDGPGAQLTDRLLALFRAEGVKASFFFLGSHADENPEVAARVIAEEHEVGSHTHGHSNAWKTLPWRMTADVDHGIRTITAVGGNPSLHRPPYGKMTIGSRLDARRRGLRIGWWTIDSRDSWNRRPIGDVVAEISAKSGGVVLMHDYDSYSRGQAEGMSHADHVVMLTQEIIALARRDGFRLMTLGELERQS
jgi:peptidoglycan/xylan/chitin deacetylase (PgdA/CDA1 family)